MKLDLRDPRSQRILLIIVGLLGVSYFYFLSETFSFTHRSRGSVLNEMRQERDRLAQEVARGRATSDRLAALCREREELAQRWLELEARLPSEHDRAEFLTDLTRLGREEHLQFMLFEPQPPRPTEFYVESDVSIRVEGDYHRLGRFLAAVANQERIVKVSSLKILSNPEAEDEEKEPAVSADMVITTFYLPENSTTEKPEAEGEGSGGEM